jgi:hypothetical protein
VSDSRRLIMKKLLILAAALISFPALTFGQTQPYYPKQNEVPLFIWLVVQRVQPLMKRPPLMVQHSYQGVSNIDQDEYNYHYGIVPLPKDFQSNMPVIRPDPNVWYPSVNERYNLREKMEILRLPEKKVPEKITVK